MSTPSRLAASVALAGSVDNRFSAVEQRFTQIVADEQDDLWAQLAIYHRGRLVVDLWTGGPAARDSLLSLYSASKGLTHLVVAHLVQDGVLDLDAPVTRYWPEFGAAGKGTLLLRELLSHQSGAVGSDEGFEASELVDDQLVADRLAGQRPFWRPGVASGYHALVMGALSAEVVRRATGATVQELFVSLLRDPLALDVHLGLPVVHDHRFLEAQPMTLTPERVRALAASTPGPSSLPGVAFNRHAAHPTEVWDLPNSAAVRARGTASFGGVGTARDLARLYATLVGEVDGHGPVLTPDTVAAVSQIQTAGQDLVLEVTKAWAVGFHASAAQYPMLSARAFGHSGAGGQQSLVDPHRQLAYVFLRRRAGFPADTDAVHGTLLRAACDAADRT